MSLEVINACEAPLTDCAAKVLVGRLHAGPSGRRGDFPRFGKVEDRPERGRLAFSRAETKIEGENLKGIRISLLQWIASTAVGLEFGFCMDDAWMYFSWIHQSVLYGIGMISLPDLIRPGLPIDYIHGLITLQIDYLHILISICEFLGVQESSNPAKYLVNSN